MARIIFILVFVSGFFLQTRVVHASCCASSSAASVGRLSKHERASISMQTSFQGTVGNFSSGARHHFGRNSHRSYFALQNSLELMTRVWPWLEPVVLIPTEIKWSAQNNGASFGDVSAGARIGVFPYEYFNQWPTLALVMMAKAPTGQAATNASILPEAITSAGVWWMLPSAIVEKSIHSMVFGLHYGLEIPFKPPAKDALEPGLKNNLVFALSGPLAPNWAWSVSNLWMWQQDTRVNDKRLLETDKRRTNLTASVTWSIHSHVKLKSHVGMDLPIHHLGKNLPANLSIGLGLRLGVY